MPLHLLFKRLDPVFLAVRENRLRTVTLAVLGASLVAGLLFWLAIRQGSEPRPGSWLLWVAASLAAVWAGRRLAARADFDVRAVARRIEDRFPDLRGRLFTALDLRERAGEAPLGYLEERVLGETLTHSTTHDWMEAVRGKREWRGTVLQGIAWLAFGMLAVQLQSLDVPLSRQLATEEAGAPESGVVLEVSPGDTEVQKGSRLIVEARFTGGVPLGATLELIDPESGESAAQFAMRGGLDDPVFAAVVPSVDRPLRYRVTHGSGASRDYAIGVFELPRLERTDVTVTPPSYAGQETVTHRDVRKVTALEGSDLAFSLTVNKPVAAAELFGEDGTVIPLVASPEDPRILTASVRPEEDGKYRVHLVDAEDRANANPPWLTVKLRRNEPPKLEFAFPGRDTEVSALQEVAFEGKVWDDLGVAKVGATVTVGERTEEITLSGDALPGRESHLFSALFPLEEHGAVPNQLVSYHLWAEDIGPDGKPRRTESDLFFAEVRDWEHIFREGVRDGAPAGQGEGQGNRSAELREQQKEVMNATWRVTRESARTGIASRLSDVGVLKEGQEQVSRNVATVLEEVEDPRLRETLESARGKMDEAAGFLGWAVEQTDGNVLPDALAAERAAYQFLLAAEARETEVTQSRSQSSSSGQGQQQQRQLMQLELKENEDRYETESRAGKEEGSEQQENLEVLGRLKELARRQEALAEQIKELEAALQTAETEEERKELERRLERLREEQEKLLRDVDDLVDRMESGDNAERMDRERDQLAEAREDVRETGEKLEQEDLSGAANSARRARDEISGVEEEFRERTGQQFAEDLRTMRQDARELAEAQERIGEEFDRAPARSLGLPTGDESEFDRAGVSTELARQKLRLEELLETMRRVSEEAETSEPLLSDTLYDAAREARVESPVESLEQASRLTRYGAVAEAHERERAAARGIDTLREGIEQAAERVLGSEGESLRMARKELDQLIEAVEAERSAWGGGDPEKPGGEDRAEGAREPGQLAAAEPAEGGERSPGQAEEEGKPGGSPAGGPRQEGTQPGEPGQPGGAGEPREAEEGGNRGPEGLARSEGTGRSPGEKSPESPGTGEPSGGSTPREGAEPPGSVAAAGGERPADGESGGGTGGGSPLFFEEEAAEPASPGPLTGGGYERFSSGLRRVEQMLDSPDLRAGASRVLDRARAMRHAYSEEGDASAPRWDLVELEVLRPLVELRRDVAEALALIEKDHPLVPVDRDPVPAPFRELVRRYYEELARGD